MINFTLRIMKLLIYRSIENGFSSFILSMHLLRASWIPQTDLSFSFIRKNLLKINLSMIALNLIISLVNNRKCRLVWESQHKKKFSSMNLKAKNPLEGGPLSSPWFISIQLKIIIKQNISWNNSLENCLKESKPK